MTVKGLVMKINDLTRKNGCNQWNDLCLICHTTLDTTQDSMYSNIQYISSYQQTHKKFT